MHSPKRRPAWGFLYASVLTLFTAYVALDAFVIPRAYTVVVPVTAAQTQTASAASSGTTGTTASTASTGTTASTSTSASTGTAASELSAAAGSASDAQTADAAETTETAEAAQETVQATASPFTDAVVQTASSYSDQNVCVTITQYREYDTDIYVADIQVTDASYLATALADDIYGKNITETTSSMAARVGAVLAINGDYYGSRNTGYVVRNGVLYRSSSSDSSQEDLVIYADGTMSVVREGDVTAQALVDAGAMQVLSFGPGLLSDGQITVSQNEEVDKASTSNPRTALGQIGPLHYVMVVADGRTDASEGLSLYQLASFLQGLGVQTAYNLDGGGSTTMVFCGTVVNVPVSGKRQSGERSVSDIVYLV